MNRSENSGGSIEGLHYVRAAAAFAVVALHAMVPYAAHPMPGLAWPVSDHRSSLVDVAFWGIELFIMPLFLLMAGYLAARSLATCDAKALWKSRFSRLAIPFVAASMTILPAELYVWVTGWVGEGLVPIQKLKSLKFDDGIDSNLWGTAHLWFLVYLLSYVALLAAGSHLLQRIRWRSKRLASILDNSPIPTRFAISVVVALAASLIVMRQPEVVWGFQHASLPVASKWFYCGLSFMAGVLIFRWDPNWKQLARFVSPMSFGAAALAAAAMWLGLRHLDRSVVSTPTGITSTITASPTAQWAAEGAAEGVAMGVCTALAALGISISIIAWSIRCNPVRRDAVRYLSAASLWVYLVHHPIVGMLHLGMKHFWSDGGGAIKSLLAIAMASGLSLFLYHFAARDRRWAQRARLVEGAKPAKIFAAPRVAKLEPMPQRRAA